MADPTDPRDIEETLLGGPLRYTRRQVEERSGVSEDYARAIWQALGFPTPPDDEVAFTDGDVTALREIKDLLRYDLVDEEMVLRLSRAVGQTMGRLAGWLGDVWLRRLSERLPPDEPVTEEAVLAALAATEELRPAFERLLMHGWRRQLAAAGMRAAGSTATATADPAAGTALLAAGFADIVSFTRLSRGMEGPALADLVERFESTTTGLVAEHGGRVIKTLGDEVLFVAQDPAAAAEIGLNVAERGEEDPDFPRVRVGMAYGEVILRLGDVFGTPVNLAARLTATAYPGSVLIDTALASELTSTTFATTPLRPRPLQGLGRVRPYLLRRGRP
ncbi:adenylate/guanylate cyclase domain-containing protein [Actinomadura sp. NBRC 104412]|uniref:adenylate/guanylate cyclase domain-containing protein n=1 Tax=Actinomadura sp. NBRC 104412 TaxID=3032203 RepID=UPI0024A05E6A|nr:adenylate/guanylate cyclase domain-containing protein [Actinomadura sp. NBRC 104412]GLZ09440.1 adenylate/guanylate cyclase domain-containing protein [Actinomadura sp. NBRC 104412]